MPNMPNMPSVCHCRCQPLLSPSKSDFLVVFSVSASLLINLKSNHVKGCILDPLTSAHDIMALFGLARHSSSHVPVPSTSYCINISSKTLMCRTRFQQTPFVLLDYSSAKRRSLGKEKAETRPGSLLNLTRERLRA